MYIINISCSLFCNLSYSNSVWIILNTYTFYLLRCDLLLHTKQNIVTNSFDCFQKTDKTCYDICISNIFIYMCSYKAKWPPVKKKRHGNIFSTAQLFLQIFCFYDLTKLCPCKFVNFEFKALMIIVFFFINVHRSISWVFGLTCA